MQWAAQQKGKLFKQKVNQLLGFLGQVAKIFLLFPTWAQTEFVICFARKAHDCVADSHVIAGKPPVICVAMWDLRIWGKTHHKEFFLQELQLADHFVAS